MSAKAHVLYDGQCPFCVSSVERLRALDWLGRLDYGDARDPTVLRRYPRVDPDRALRRLQLVIPGEGPVLEGFHALRALAARLPLLWPLWPLLWIPGVAPICVRVYDRIARGRFAFGSCPGGAGDRDRPGEPPGGA